MLLCHLATGQQFPILSRICVLERKIAKNYKFLHLLDIFTEFFFCVVFHFMCAKLSTRHFGCANKFIFRKSAKKELRWSKGALWSSLNSPDLLVTSKMYGPKLTFKGMFLLGTPEGGFKGTRKSHYTTLVQLGGTLW